MKTLYLLAIALVLISSSACKKSNNTRNEPESQGQKFNLLLKTVTKINNTGREIVTEYIYNAAGQLSEVKMTNNISANKSETVETFYRNAAGRTDSIAYSSKINGVVSIITKTIFKYDFGGKLIFSLHSSNNYTNPPTKDSSVYDYDGAVLQKI